jgi:hypothetical protein
MGCGCLRFRCPSKTHTGRALELFSAPRFRFLRSEVLLKCDRRGLDFRGDALLIVLQRQVWVDMAHVRLS